MDAAKFISTLNLVSPPSQAPDSANFAILDFAADDDLLRRIYAATLHEVVPWRSLFEDTNWFDQWKHGPALVDLRQCPLFRKALIDQMADAPIGLLLETSWSMDDLHAHLTRWIHEGLSAEGQLLRLQEARMFGPLLSAMGEPQTQALLVGGTIWLWHDTHTWRCARPSQPTTAYEHGDIPKLSQAKLEAAASYWLAAQAYGYSEHYKGVLANQVVPVHWVLEQLLEAKANGLQASSHLERWLRLTIQHGEGFHRRSPFAALLDQPQATFHDRLSAMEGASEYPHVPV